MYTCMCIYIYIYTYYNEYTIKIYTYYICRERYCNERVYVCVCYVCMYVCICVYIYIYMLIIIISHGDLITSSPSYNLKNTTLIPKQMLNVIPLAVCCYV